jgi:hypothetical protein
MTTTTVNEAAGAVAGTDYSLLKRAAAWPLALLRALAEVYRSGLMLAVVAPAIFAIAVLPEAAQHVAEIQLGMFTSREAFIAHSFNSTRMMFGGFKVAGLFLCIFAAARFVHFGTVRAAVRMPWRDVGRTLFAAAIGFAASLPGGWATRTAQPPEIYWPAHVASWVLSTLLLVYLIGALLGDREMTLRASLTRGWKVLPPLMLLGVAAFWPATTLHSYLHKVAIGAEPALVWTLMAADSLLIGLLGTLLGSALAVSYRLGRGSASQKAR